MDEKVLEKQIETMETTYLDENVDEVLANENSKLFTNKCKMIDILMKDKMQNKQLDQDSKKLEFEIEQAKAQRELDSRKVANDENRATNEKLKFEADLKNQELRMQADLKKVEVDLKKIELDAKRLELEREQAKTQADQEAKRIELEAQKIANDKAKADADIKEQKKSFWLGVAKVAVILLGTIAGIGLTIWSVVVGMKFEETGSVRSSVGKFAINFASKTIAKLDHLNVG